MKCLLDTHVFIWWDSDPAQLSTRAMEACSDPANELWLSAASLWEMQIKAQLGKLRLSRPLRDLVDGQREANGLQLLAVDASHVYALSDLPDIHRDPFDRLLLVQAKCERMTVISCDSLMQAYRTDIVW